MIVTLFLLTVCNQVNAESFSGKWKLVSLVTGESPPKNRETIMEITCKEKSCHIVNTTKSVLTEKPLSSDSDWSIKDNNTLSMMDIDFMHLDNGKLINDKFIYQKLP